jgi:AraC family transcriptional regulator
VELAALVNVSARHFGRLFKASTGLSPHAFMNELRVERARRLLGEGELCVAAVAAEVGFSNPSHFAAFFRRATGEAPGAFRRVARVGRRLLRGDAPLPFGGVTGAPRDPARSPPDGE